MKAVLDNCGRTRAVCPEGGVPRGRSTLEVAVAALHAESPGNAGWLPLPFPLPLPH